VRLAVVLFFAATPALADPALDGDAFDRLTLGQTMTWAEFGRVYGVEQYLPDRRVRWTFAGDTCLEGSWYQDGEAICFQYGGGRKPACWVMVQTDTGLTAADTDDGPDVAPVVITATTEPLACFGPKVGV